MKASPAKIEIRKATAADALLLSVLATATFYEAYFEQDDPADLAGYIHESFEVENVKTQLEDPSSTFYLLLANGAAVGYAKMLAGSPEPCIKTAKTIELKRIYILERVWGTGLGEKLLEHCLENARSSGYGSVWLGVWEQNERGQRFYRKYGFVQAGILEFPYGDSVGINLVLEKTL